MDFSAINPAVLFASLIMTATPILLAGLGALLVEKSGVLNLGVEGMMIIGAISGFATAVSTGSPILGFLGGALGGAALSLIFAILTQYFLANQTATGLALTLFGLGFSAMLGQGYIGIKPPAFPKMDFGPLSDIPFLGTALLRQDLMVYVALALVVVFWWVLNRSRAGLVLRAVGENHEAAHALGYKVRRIRVLAILIGGAMAGLGGAYLSIVRVPLWTEGMTSGAGWIAIALVVFASWKPFRLMLGAWLFGGISVLQLNLQAAGAKIPTEYLAMSPYVITIVVLVIMSARGGRQNSAPAALGRNFHATH